MKNPKIGDFVLREYFDNSQPQHCERRGCLEELNGLNNFSISLGDGVVMNVYLCDYCAIRFRRKFMGKKR